VSWGSRAGLLAAAVWPARGPAGGMWRLPGLLKPRKDALRDPQLLQRHVAVQLAVGVKGAAWLLNRQAAVRRALGDGLAQYEFSQWPEPFWVDVRADRAEGGWGPAPREFAVRLKFADAEQARRALGRELDVMAELGAGRLRVEGRLPLAEGLDGVMNEVERLLGAA
jgi:hypothetical protein